MQERKLATIRKIDAIKSIDVADRIEIAVIGGWQVVVNKGLYQPGSLVVYCEPDSWIPHELAPFLSKGKEPRVFEGISGERLRTVKLKGCISQGLVLPLDVLGQPHEIFSISPDSVGADVTSELGILKWEKPIPAQLRGQVRGHFPSLVPKTDQERVQNLGDVWEELKSEHLWSVTEKLDGSSLTAYLDLDGDFHVCSRNLDLKEDENNAYWRAARKFRLEELMKENNLYGYAIQGELLGEGIQGNNYKVDLEFYAFDVYDTNQRQYLLPDAFQELMQDLGIKQVPVLENWLQLKAGDTIEDVLEIADGTSKLHDVQREGLVFRSRSQHDLSFKSISRAWLLNYE